MFTLNRHYAGARYKLGTLDEARKHGDATLSANATSVNPFTIDYVQNRPKGHRHQVPDPTHLYMEAIPYNQPGNSIRTTAWTNFGGDASDGLGTGPEFWKTQTMLRRQEMLHDILVREQQGWLFSDQGTWSSPYTGMDLGSFRPMSSRRWK